MERGHSDMRFNRCRKILQANGFFMRSTRGGHVKFYNPETNKNLVITFPAVNRMLWNRLMKEHNINDGI